MQIKSAEYFKSLVTGSEIPENFPVYAFIGRSNVGKSSFINTITGQKDLCRSGGTPGVTRKVNLFKINKNILFADLPGYGYAKMSHGERKKLEELIFWYLRHPENQFQTIFILVEAKVGPTANDLEIIDYLNQKNLPLTIIASKIDKLRSSEKAAQLKKISQMIPGYPVIPFSASSGEGKKDVLSLIVQ